MTTVKKNSKGEKEGGVTTGTKRTESSRKLGRKGRELEIVIEECRTQEGEEEGLNKASHEYQVYIGKQEVFREFYVTLKNDIREKMPFDVYFLFNFLNPEVGDMVETPLTFFSAVDRDQFVEIVRSDNYPSGGKWRGSTLDLRTVGHIVSQDDETDEERFVDIIWLPFMDMPLIVQLLSHHQQQEEKKKNEE